MLSDSINWIFLFFLLSSLSANSLHEARWMRNGEDRKKKTEKHEQLKKPNKKKGKSEERKKERERGKKEEKMSLKDFPFELSG